VNQLIPGWFMVVSGATEAPPPLKDACRQHKGRGLVETVCMCAESFCRRLMCGEGVGLHGD
jgi:hypothetical protein